MLLIELVALLCAAPSQARNAPLRDPVLMRIGLLCRWDNHCMREQVLAMSAALDYVNRKRPPTQRLHVCNRNASRGPNRVDWIGFNRCIRNKRIGRLPGQ